MTTAKANVDDLAGQQHWDQMWAQEAFPPDVEPRGASLWAHRDRLFHGSLQRALAGRPPGARIVELGCARSAWLPYFAREFGFEVAGLDYSPLGVQQTEQRLNASAVPGEVRCADLFAPPPEWIHAFDVVSWFGVAEHFQNTAGAIGAAAKLLKPGGLMVTEIPNMVGLNGWLQWAFNRPVYDIHVPLSAPALAAAHADAGLTVLSAEYLVPLDFGVVDVDEIPMGIERRVKDKILYFLRLFGGCVWWLDRRFGPFRPGVTTGGFVMVVAEKPPVQRPGLVRDTK